VTSSVTAVTAERYARGTAIAAVVVAASWHVVNDLAGLVGGWSVYRWPTVSAAAWVVVSALNVAGAVNMLSHRARARLALPLVGVPLLLVCTAAVFADSRTGDFEHGGGMFTAFNWAWGSFGWQAMLLLWRWPLRWLLAAIGANVAVCLVSAFATGPVDRVALSRMVVVFWGTSSIQLAVAGGGRALVRAGERAARASAERAELLTARHAADQVHADRERRYRGIGKAVRQLLTGLASGELEPGDAQVKRRCAVEASRLRRLIAEHDDTPSPLLHELRACADVAERRDVAVTLETAGTLPALPVQVRRALTEAPIHVLAAARTEARVTVVARTSPPEVEVSVVADADADAAYRKEAGEEVEVIWSMQGDDQWVRSRWRER
jgi:hypothetical protein